MEIENSKIGQLVIDVYQTKSYFVVQIPIAGVEEKDLEVKVENNIWLNFFYYIFFCIMGPDIYNFIVV